MLAVSFPGSRKSQSKQIGLLPVLAETRRVVLRSTRAVVDVVHTSMYQVCCVG